MKSRAGLHWETPSAGAISHCSWALQPGREGLNAGMVHVTSRARRDKVPSDSHTHCKCPTTTCEPVTADSAAKGGSLESHKLLSDGGKSQQHSERPQWLLPLTTQCEL